MAQNKKEQRYQADCKSYRRVRSARRTMLYVVRTLLLVTVGVIICIAAFMTCERLSNLYILSTEGMNMRADCVLQDGARNDLEEYFTTELIEKDDRLNRDDYAGYTVSSYDYDLAIEKISVLPWGSSATVTCVETVSVKGTINSDRLSEGEKAEDYPPPTWESARYRIRFINTGARWYISELELLETNPSTAPLNTPDLSQSIHPMATPTPAPTDIP